MHSIKVVTKQTVESGQPICATLSKHESIHKDNIKLLLYRLQKMYAAKSDAQKILTLFLKLEHDTAMAKKSNED